MEEKTRRMLEEIAAEEKQRRDAEYVAAAMDRHLATTSVFKSEYFNQFTYEANQEQMKQEQHLAQIEALEKIDEDSRESAIRIRKYLADYGLGINTYAAEGDAIAVPSNQFTLEDVSGLKYLGHWVVTGSFLTADCAVIPLHGEYRVLAPDAVWFNARNVVTGRNLNVSPTHTPIPPDSSGSANNIDTPGGQHPRLNDHSVEAEIRRMEERRKKHEGPEQAGDGRGVQGSGGRRGPKRVPRPGIRRPKHRRGENQEGDH